MTLRKALASLLASALLLFSSVVAQPAQAQILHNDQFAFFAADENDTDHPYCQALLYAQGKFDLVGVNIYEFQTLSTEQAARVFEYLQKCGVNVIRVFGAGTIAEMQAMASLIQSAPAGMSFVVAVSNPVTGEGQTMRMYSDKTAWFSGTGAQAYYSWATQAASSLQPAKSKIAIIEMANEPHCGGAPGCIDPFAAWSDKAADILKTVAPVSIGGGLLDTGANGVENPGGGQGSNIRQANGKTDFVSVHWYPENESSKGEMIDAVMALFGKSKVYIGEVGFDCKASPCTNATPETIEANAQKLRSQVIDRYSGAHGLIYWSFGGFLTGDPGGESLATEDPNSLFIYPYMVEDLPKYFANSQVYCAPQQLYLEKAAAPPPPLTVCSRHHPSVVGEENSGVQIAEDLIDTSDLVCTQYEYPIIENEDSYQLSGGTNPFSFPLFRAEGGTISIEADLSRVKPSDTFAVAAERNSRPDYAPQFYLSTPETQCRNVVQYIKFITEACAQYHTGEGTCPSNLTFTLPDGSTNDLFTVAPYFEDEASCANFSEEMANNSERAVYVQSISPQLRKVFKMGFLVKHTWFHAEDFLEKFMYLQQSLAHWFDTNKFPDPDPGKWANYGEQLTLIPIWYNTGIATGAFDEFQHAEPYTFDPEKITVETEPDLNEDAFSGPWWKTYAALTPLETQKTIAYERMQWVRFNWDLMQTAVGGYLQPSLTSDPVFPMVQPPGEPIIECMKGQCLCFGPTRGEDGKPTDPLNHCPNQEVHELIGMFPKNQLSTEQNFMYSLKQNIVSRINAGVQKTIPYGSSSDTYGQYGPRYLQGQEVTSGFGPRTYRSFERCPADQMGASQPVLDGELGATERTDGYGWQEKAQQIGSAFVREGVGAMAEEIKMAFSTKVVPEKANADTRKTTRNYLILPEEASAIETAQAYFTPMFLSPEMYDTIMRGESDLYPFQEQYRQQLATMLGQSTAEETPESTTGDVPQATAQQTTFLSAFLRAFGLNRSFISRRDGYGQFLITRTTYACVADCNVLDCSYSLGEPISTETYYHPGPAGDMTPKWVPLSDAPQEVKPSCAAGGVAIGETWSLVQESTVELIPGNVAPPAVPSPNPNPEGPGQLAAMHEFFRRMAFTPLHMQGYSTYPTLETYYLGTGGGTTSGSGVGTQANQCLYSEPRTVDMSQYAGNPAAVNETVCSEVAQSGLQVHPAVVRALLQVEGREFRDVVDGGSSTMVCQANSAGAIGPMNIVIGMCSNRPGLTLRNSLNTADANGNPLPDICLLPEAIQASLTGPDAPIGLAVRLAAQHPELNTIFKQAEFISEVYHGAGTCGCLSSEPSCVPPPGKTYQNDGVSSLYGTGVAAGDEPDYCQLVAQIAVDYANICK